MRERFREDAERHYELLFNSIREALESDVVRWGDCPSCGHRVGVSFPDIRARTLAVQMLVDQGYGKPTESVRVSSGQDFTGEETAMIRAAISASLRARGRTAGELTEVSSGEPE